MGERFFGERILAHRLLKEGGIELYLRLRQDEIRL
jgi:hypothetical protein